MKKIIVLLFALMLVGTMIGCAQSAVLEEPSVYYATSDIHSLEINVGAADFTIKPSESFSVESNLKYLSVSEKDGVLRVIDKKTKGVTYDNPVLILYMPADKMFEYVNITTGAGRLTADTLSAKSLELKLGAGDVSIAAVHTEDDTDIIGGAGEITIYSGTIRNLDLEMGVGELNLTASLLGNSELTFGVGESNLTIIGNRKDYKIEADKGLGSIAVDGNPITEYDNSGGAQNRVQIQGGVGSIHINFQEVEGSC